MTVKRPVSGSLARAFFSMIVLSVLISAIALVTLASSQRDAEAINIAGSLRMQSYRLGYELQRACVAEAKPLVRARGRQTALPAVAPWLAGDGHANRQRRYRVVSEPH